MRRLSMIMSILALLAAPILGFTVEFQYARGTLGPLTSETRASQAFSEYTQRFTVALTSSGTATIDIECSTNGGSNWETLRTFTADAVTVEDANCDAIAINVTSYTSGTINARYHASLIKGSK